LTATLLNAGATKRSDFDRGAAVTLAWPDDAVRAIDL
jgi:hypothetical protein